MIFRLDPKKFSDYPPEESVDGSEIVPIVKDGENSSVTIGTMLADSPSSDKNYTQEFTNSASVLVEHNLGKMPAVTVINSAGDEVVGDIAHLNENELVVLFSNSFTGIIICN